MSGETHINSCRNCGAKISACARCGRPVVAGDGMRVGVSFVPEQLARLILDTTDFSMQERLLCALGTVDRDLEQRTRMELASTEPREDPAMAQLAAAQSEIEELRGIICDMENAPRE